MCPRRGSQKVILKLDNKNYYVDGAPPSDKFRHETKLFFFLLSIEAEEPQINTDQLDFTSNLDLFASAFEEVAEEVEDDTTQSE